MQNSTQTDSELRIILWSLKMSDGNLLHHRITQTSEIQCSIYKLKNDIKGHKRVVNLLCTKFTKFPKDSLDLNVSNFLLKNLLERFCEEGTLGCRSYGILHVVEVLINLQRGKLRGGCCFIFLSKKKINKKCQWYFPL